MGPFLQLTVDSLFLFFTQLQRLQVSLKNFQERNHHATGNCSGCLRPAFSSTENEV